MAEHTVINPAIQPSSVTVINREIAEAGSGPETDSSVTISEGTIICDRYRVIKQMEVSSGEADLYLCTDGAEQFVAKVYKRQFAIKQEVIDALLTIDSPYVARLYQAGTWNGFPVEILPFYENGSLQGKTFTEEELIERIIPNINEGLHVLHEAGIIHKDLKPSNIMLNNDGKTVAITDFGISSMIDKDSTVLVTKTGMSPEYSAPETFKNLFLRESDYYSFGITLIELFCGSPPYANLQPEEIEQYVSIQRVPCPENMSPRLQDFISALTYYDITNRNDKNNPNRRWTYEEVRKWLDGEPLVIPGEGTGNVEKTMSPFRFMGEEYTDPALLVTAFAENWNEGKKLLFRGMVTNHFRTWNPKLADMCQEAEEQAGRENGKDDIIFWRLLYRISPELKGFCWKGQIFESLPAFGRDVLERLWKKDKSQFSYYSGILSEKVLSQYVSIAAPENEKLKKAAEAIEDSYELERINGTDMRRTYYLMAYTLSGQKLLLLDGEQIRTCDELAEYMRRTLAESFGKFEQLCHRLVDYEGNLDLQLETWLMAIGKQDQLETWRASLAE